MSEPVPKMLIEQIVGAPRHPTDHLGMTDGLDVYILHSQQCLSVLPDLTLCAYSVALDRGGAPDWPFDTTVTIEFNGLDRALGHS